MTKVAAVALAVSLFACEKSPDFEMKASGKLTSDEQSMLAELPAGNTALFGGNVLDFQKQWANSPLMKFTQAQQGAASKASAAWMECVSTLSWKAMLGGVQVAFPKFTAHFVMRGLDLAALDTCATKAEIEHALDADGRYLSITIPSEFGAIKSGYYKLPSGTLMSRVVMQFPPEGVEVTRADFEAIEKALPSANATADKALIAELESLDRAGAIWFVGDGTKTPLGANLGLVKGTMDVSGGLKVDMIVQLNDKKMADQMEKAIPDLKKNANMLGKEAVEVVNQLRFSRKGDRVRFGLKVTNAQLEGLLKKLPMGMMGGGF